MKKIIKPLILVLIVSILGFLGYKIAAKISHKKEVAQRIQQLPDFSYNTLKGVVVTQNTLNKNYNTVFINFNTECDYCKHEAAQISEHFATFKNTQFVFVSNQDANTITTFANTYNLLHHDTIVFALDTNNDFSTTFDTQSFPYAALYNPNKQLIKIFKGSVTAKALLKALKVIEKE